MTWTLHVEDGSNYPRQNYLSRAESSSCIFFFLPPSLQNCPQLKGTSLQPSSSPSTLAGWFTTMTDIGSFTSEEFTSGLCPSHISQCPVDQTKARHDLKYFVWLFSFPIYFILSLAGFSSSMNAVSGSACRELSIRPRVNTVLIFPNHILINFWGISDPHSGLRVPQDLNWVKCVS